MAQERAKAVTLKGNPFTLVGPELKVGDAAPDFTAADGDLKPVSRSGLKGVTVLLSVPSLDTPVCDAEARRFNKEAAGLPGVSVVLVSVDLPFAQKRYCGAAGIDKVRVLSDYKDRSFGAAYGVFIKELALLARAVFVVGENGKLTYVQYVKEVAEQPDFDKLLGHLRQAAKV
ncbi:MAG: thiol peroxidase [Elusimicrobia bacterium]|nr:thiol peroxidase [Elusimicrobiota bacterium]